MKTLEYALQDISNDSNWGIYASYPLTAQTEIRFGQPQFENGGLLDEKKFVINGESANDRIQDMIDVSLGEEDYQREIAIETLIDELNAEACPKHDYVYAASVCTCHLE